MSELEFRDTYVCVHTIAHSTVLNVASNIADERVAQMYSDAVSKCGGHVFKTCKASELVAALSEIEPLREVASWAQATLTALNVGDVASGSLLHLKLREVMIAYREKVRGEDGA